MTFFFRMISWSAPFIGLSFVLFFLKALVYSLSWKICTVTKDTVTAESLLLFARTSIGLCSPPDFLRSVLAFLLLFSWGLFLLIQAMSYRPVFGLILCVIQEFINHAKTLPPPKQILNLNTKMPSGLVHFG